MRSHIWFESDSGVLESNELVTFIEKWRRLNLNHDVRWFKFLWSKNIKSLKEWKLAFMKFQKW